MVLSKCGTRACCSNALCRVQFFLLVFHVLDLQHSTDGEGQLARSWAVFFLVKRLGDFWGWVPFVFPNTMT